MNSKWEKIVNSPFMLIIFAFQGVSITFAPLFIYWCGKGTFFPEYHKIILPICFGLVYVVPLFYYILGGAVIKELKRKKRNS